MKKYTIFLLFFFPFLLWGQNNRNITGKVTDVSNVPLPGVLVSIPNSTSGVITAADGSFELTVSSTVNSLIFSFIGMTTEAVRITDKPFYHVILKEEVYELDEVVAVGYGYMRKSDLTGSVSSLGSEITSGRIVNNLEDALQGRIAGVQIINNDGTPGGGSEIKIRGVNSISASNSPLYVIDGISYDMNENSGEFDFWEYGTTPNNPLGSISPGDIESIEVLKDASATAIYGSRGVNGVILITTKQGKEGKAKLEYVGNVRINQIKRKIDLLNGPEYAKFLFDVNGGYSNSSNPYINWQEYTTNTDWQDELFRTAYTNDHRISIRGGNRDVRYSFMGSLYDQQGVIINSGYKRYTGRFNASVDLLRNFTLNTNISASYGKTDGVTTGFIYGVVTKALQMSPLKTLDDLYAEMEDGDVIYNPIADTQTSVRDRTDRNYQVAADLVYKFSTPFTLKLKGAYVDRSTLNEGFIPANNPRSKTNGSASISQYTSSKLLGEATLSYYKRIDKKHRINLMGGATIEKYVNKRFGISVSNFGIDVLGINNISMGNTVNTPYNSLINTSLVSFIGRANYNYIDKYLVTATFRADGSSKFASGNKFAYFPSLAFAWRASEEDFLKSADFLSDLKLRSSFGIVGNQAIPAYESLGILQNSKITPDGKNSTDGVYPLRIDNKSLKWESTHQYNVGLDAGFLNNRISLVTDVYYKKTKDMLLEMNVPRYTGFSTYWTNIGSVENKGLEFTLNTLNISKTDFKWKTSLNIAFNRSKVLDLGLDDRLELSGDRLNITGTIGLIQVGKPIGLFYGYQVEGIWQSEEEIKESELISQLGTAVADIKPGYRKYKDVNEDGVIDDADKEIIGYGEPTFTGGFFNSFEYKNFELAVNLQFSVGGDLFNVNRVMLENGDKANNQSGLVRDRYRPSYGSPGDENYDPGNISYSVKRADTDVQRVPTSDYIESGSFLRISDVTLAYNFRNIFKVKGSNLKVYLSGKNLHVFSKYLGYDPEVNTAQAGYASLLPGLDLDAYPRAATYTIGCTLNF